MTADMEENTATNRSVTLIIASTMLEDIPGSAYLLLVAILIRINFTSLRDWLFGYKFFGHSPCTGIFRFV